MANTVDKIEILNHVFEQTETPSFLTERTTHTVDLSTLLCPDEQFKFTDSHIEVEWSASEAPSGFPVDSSHFSILKTLLKDYCEENDLPTPSWLRLGTAMLFRNANYQDTRFADQEVIRLRATQNYKGTGPWFDGVSTIWPNGQGDTERNTPLEIPGVRTPISFHGDMSRLFYRVDLIFVAEHLKGPYILGRKLGPVKASRNTSPIPKPAWADSDKIMYNWPLLKEQGRDSAAAGYEIIPANNVEACVYLAPHCASEKMHWAVVDNDEMPYHEVYSSGVDDELLYQQLPRWYGSAGKKKIANEPDATARRHTVV